MKLHSNIFGWEYVWEEFADEKGGSLVKDAQKILAVTVPARNLESSIVFSPMAHGTQVVANYLPADEFVFQVFVQKLIHKVAFGAKNIKVSDALFDSRYVIRSNRADAVQDTFRDASLREWILQEQIDELELMPAGSRVEPFADLPAGHGSLVLKRHVFFDKFEQLEAALDIMTRLLENLEKRRPSTQMQEPAAPSEVHPHRLHSPLLDR